MTELAEVVLDATTRMDSLIEQSTLGTPGARELRDSVTPAVAAAVVEQADAAPRPNARKSATAVRDYRTPESVPRPGGRLTKEDLDPLVKDAGEGNPAAIHNLLQMIEPVVVRYCRARMGGSDLSYLSADDVAQEVCLAVLKALPDYQDRGGSFLYLVHAIAANKVADAYRAVARDRSDPVSELPERPWTGPEPEAHALHADLGARLGRLLATLPKVQQEILTLRIALGLSASEIAEVLGTTPGHVRVTQHRALARLRQMSLDADSHALDDLSMRQTPPAPRPRGDVAAESGAGVAQATRVVPSTRQRLVEELVKKYKSGSSIRALAEATGRSYGFVHRVLSEAGVPLRGRGGATRVKKK